ncbi:GNAT family N-acetyltransferase [Lysobacter enzymogenes]
MRADRPAERGGTGSSPRSTDATTPMDHRNLRLRDWRADDRNLGLALFDSNTPRFFAASERQDFIDFIDDLPGPYFVLEDADGRALGCGGYATARNDASKGVLCWGMVHGDLHREGLGSILLAQRLARIAADPSSRFVSIETSQHSCGFFARRGFVETRRTIDGFAAGMDLVEMTLALARPAPAL